MDSPRITGKHCRDEELNRATPYWEAGKIKAAKKAVEDREIEIGQINLSIMETEEKIKRLKIEAQAEYGKCAFQFKELINAMDQNFKLIHNNDPALQIMLEKDNFPVLKNVQLPTNIVDRTTAHAKIDEIFDAMTQYRRNVLFHDNLLVKYTQLLEEKKRSNGVQRKLVFNSEPQKKKAVAEDSEHTMFDRSNEHNRIASYEDARPLQSEESIHGIRPITAGDISFAVNFLTANLHVRQEPSENNQTD